MDGPLGARGSRAPRGARLLACAFAAALVAGCVEQVPRRNVLLIVVDTLRADHLSVYGYERQTSPNIDRLARESVRFTHAQSPRAKTTPSVTSLLTGLYPQDHGVRDLTTPLESGVATLPEAFRTSGYATAAIIGNYVLRKELSGLDRGFDVWDEELPQTKWVPPAKVPERTAQSLTDRALDLLGLGEKPWKAPLSKGTKPWFLWLHYMDPHGIYEPPAEHRIFASAPPRPVFEDLAADRYVAVENAPPDARLEGRGVDANRVIAAYDGEIHYLDAELGRLLDRMRDAGLLEDTWVVFVADHGESLGEHDYWFEHGRYAYEATCRVPLVIRPPSAMKDRPAPGVRHGDLSLVDLAPTLLDLCDLRPLKAHAASGSPRGRSRADLFERDDSRVHPVFGEVVERAEKTRAVQIQSVRSGDWKLIQHTTQTFEPGRPLESETRLIDEALYDLSQDPGEEHDLIRDPPPGAPLERLRAALQGFIDADAELADLARTLQQRREELSHTDPEALRRLEALGY